MFSKIGFVTSLIALTIGTAFASSNSVRVGAVTEGSGPVGSDVGVVVGLSHNTNSMKNGDYMKYTAEYMNYRSLSDFDLKGQYVWNDPLWDLGVGLGVYSLDGENGGRKTRLGVPVSLIHHFKSGNFLQVDYNFIPSHQQRNTIGLSLGTRF